ncbi:NADH dehydrogenase [ubiquinone] 1 beta subcomplex subunit 3-like [Aethina tumida]|uniref:NADH dehydrogenase [ubiquinone] 1 beta subcomplex subunit 3-like n=1 Tax=Aethina tumida TaxID=116153 RepID=UPI00096B6103|nr:NADH dehydrogenase [ubiquinone] 1 beta subcomplex subunit 3-like [Aethina tumida]
MGEDKCSNKSEHEDEHHEPYTVPDYKIYKVEDVPELATVQKALASQGLCDPWLRNEVWRYNVKQFGTEKTRLKAVFFRGFTLGLGAFVLTAIGSVLYDRFVRKEHEHHDYQEMMAHTEQSEECVCEDHTGTHAGGSEIQAESPGEGSSKEDSKCKK